MQHNMRHWEGPFYVYKNQQDFGPYSPAEMRTLIRTNQLSGDAYFWKEGFADWKPLFPSDPKQSGSPKQLARLAYFGTE